MFSEKKLRIEITLYDYKTLNGEIVTDFSSGKTLIFDNYRIDCKIKKVPSVAGYTASVDIYGVSKETLEQMTLISWIDGEIKPRGIKIFADDGNGYVSLFEGGIMEAVPNYKNIPNTAIHIESSMLVYPNLMKVPPISIRKGTNISLFCKELCMMYDVSCTTDEKLNRTWNGGGKTFNQESLGDRLDAISAFLKLDYNFTTSVRIFDRGEEQRRIWYFTPLDYVGYPTFETFGVCITTNNVTLDINCYDRLNISDSEVSVACSTWQIVQLEYNLQSRKPKGVWEMKIHTSRLEV